MNLRMKKSFEAFGLRWSRTKERGATAVVIALCLTLLMAAAAMSFDTANLALQRQKLQNLTDAAAQAGAVYLRDNPKDLAGAQLAAYNFAHDADSTFKSEDVTLWCVVPSNGAAVPDIASGALPCKPITWTGKKCDVSLCSIQILLPSSASANAIRVKHKEDVKFYFAPAIGIANGTTGAVASVSCINSCGNGAPNPADVAIVADRTPSMSNSDFDQMKTGIIAGLQTMTPEYQSVTLGTINRSGTSTTDKDCLTSQGPPTAKLPNGSIPDYYAAGGARAGAWMPLGFSNSYLSGKPGDPASSRTVTVTKSPDSLGYQIQCMDHVPNDTSANPNPYYVAGTQMAKYPWGTHLAAPLKAAAQLLYHPSNSNLKALSDYRATHYTTVPAKKWIIFETDGQPDETMGYNSNPTKSNNKVVAPGFKDTNTNIGTTSIDTAGEPTALDPFSTAADTKACQNFIDVATSAKKAGINIIMIAFGDATTAQCGSMSGTVANVMAKAASPINGTPSSYDKSCTGTLTTSAPENTDGDYLFCATTGAELASVFETVVQLTSSPNTKFVDMPQ